MMIVFKTLNSTIEKYAYNLSINNIAVSSDHWGSEKNIAGFFDEIENILNERDQNSFNKKILLHALELKKYSPRVIDMTFYRIPEQNKIIILSITDIKKFQDIEPFKREINMSFKFGGKFQLSVIEVLETEQKEMKEKNISVPSDWEYDDYLNDRFQKLKEYN
jgi:hypothetical protein